jgi:hypothetical protein
MEPFLWIPGQGVDASALARLRAHFTRPSEAMGEAWLMGDNRQMFDALLGDLDLLPTSALQEPLGEIASGTSSFGPRPEWDAWFHYLLGALVPRSHEAFVSYLLEYLVSGFIALHPNGVHRAPYAGFRDDVLMTLGRCMMDAQCWKGSDIVVGRVLHRPHGTWGDTSGDLSASMCLCLKYLPSSQVEPWLRSVLAIPSPHWRAQLMVWMVGAHDMLNGTATWPSQWPEGAYPAVDWEWSHCLKPALATLAGDGNDSVGNPFLPEDSRAQALLCLEAYFSPAGYAEWLDSIRTVPSLENALGDTPLTFQARYVQG